MNNSLMQFEGVAAVFAVIAIICLFAGYKLLASSSWFGGWLRGNLGIFFILLTGGLVLCVLDIHTYKPMFDDKTVATLSLRETSAQHYEVRLVDAMGLETRYSVAGDSWFLTANQFRWSKRLSLGLGHGYRFTTITGKYNNATSVASEDKLSQSRYFDVWRFLGHSPLNGFLVSTGVMITEPQPLADAAMYEVVPLGLELVVKPLNELAKRAQLASAQSDTTQVQSSTDTPVATTSIADATVAPVIGEKTTQATPITQNTSSTVQ